MSIVGWVSEAPTRLRERANQGIRDAAGLTHDPPPICTDPAESYMAPDSISRLIHGDLSSMMIGGIAALLFEMLHPHSMAGVAQHSRYRDDPLDRVLQTANFIGYTTYGSRSRAHGAIERVLSVHQAVRGVADDGQPYYANDPHLLAWIHDAGASMFLRGYQRYGAVGLSESDADRYVLEQATLARDLGAENPPTTVAELDAALEAFRPELRLSHDGTLARDFVERGIVRGALQRTVYRLLVESAYSILDPWARELLGSPSRPLRNRWVLRPATGLLTWAVRLAVPPVPPFTSP